jgi:glycine/D-amino acid oxidase-like deaminating enzyme
MGVVDQEELALPPRSTPTSSSWAVDLAGTALSYPRAGGVESVLVERGELNREASGTNAGSFHFQIAIHQLTGAGDEERASVCRRRRLHAEAAEVWKGLERELDGPLSMHSTGGLMVAETEEQLRLCTRSA